MKPKTNIAKDFSRIGMTSDGSWIDPLETERGELFADRKIVFGTECTVAIVSISNSILRNLQILCLCL